MIIMNKEGNCWFFNPLTAIMTHVQFLKINLTPYHICHTFAISVLSAVWHFENHRHLILYQLLVVATANWDSIFLMYSFFFNDFLSLRLEPVFFSYFWATLIKLKPSGYTKNCFKKNIYVSSLLFIDSVQLYGLKCVYFVQFVCFQDFKRFIRCLIHVFWKESLTTIFFHITINTKW